MVPVAESLVLVTQGLGHLVEEHRSDKHTIEGQTAIQEGN